MSRRKDATGRRATSLGPHDRFLLDAWGDQLREAFGGTAYLVGSVARAEERWRDVDVRMVADWPFDPALPLRGKTLNLAVTLWGRQLTGLPIDFQFQEADLFADFPGPRNPLFTDPDPPSKLSA